MHNSALLAPVSVDQMPPAAATNATDPSDDTTALETTMQAHTEVPKHAGSGAAPLRDSLSHCATSSSSSQSAPPHSSTPSNSYLQAAFNESPTHSKHASLVGTASQDKLPINASNGRPRATSLTAKQMPHRLTENYRELARDFRALKPFTRLPDGTYPPGTRCVFCEIGTPKTVFFPCQHKCVCDMCIKLHDICADRTRPSAWSACPVCMTDIRLLLPFTGHEEDKYWKWVSEVQPMLPSHFKLEFKDAAKRLRKSAVLPGNESAPDHPGLPKQPSGRCNTWDPSTLGRSKAASASGDPRNCAIL